MVPLWEVGKRTVRVISKTALRNYWEKHPEARQALEAWFQQIESADWDTPAKVVEEYPRVSVVRGDRLVFRMMGNRLRLIVWVKYRYRVVYVKWIGTHSEYSKINAEIVGL